MKVKNLILRCSDRVLVSSHRSSQSVAEKWKLISFQVRSTKKEDFQRRNCFIGLQFHRTMLVF